MLPTIDLDDDPEPMTGKIGQVRAYRRLATKVVLLEWRLAQMLPEFLFACGGVATQCAGAGHAVVYRTLRCLWHPPPTPDPSPPLATLAGGGEKVGARCKVQIQNRTFSI